MNNALIIKFFKFPTKQKLILIEASAYTLWALFIIHIFSFKKYIKWVKNPTINHPSEETLKLVYSSIKKINKYAFWPTTCYTEAIAARLLLRKRDIQSKIFLGVSKDKNGQLHAHAWTKADKLIITGGGNLKKYKIIYTFDD